MCDIILHTRASLSDIQHWAIVQAFSHESHEAIHVTTINQLQYGLYTNKTWSNSLITLTNVTMVIFVQPGNRIANRPKQSKAK